MRIYLTRIAVASSLIVASAGVGASPAQALAAFAGLCIGSDGDLATIEKMATAAGAKAIPAEVVNQDPAIARSGGKGFAFNRGDLRFALTATYNGACSILFEDVKATGLQVLLEKNYPLAKPFVETAGPQTNTMYRITDPSIHSGSYIMLTVPKPGFGIDRYLSLGFIPKAAAARMGIGRK